MSSPLSRRATAAAAWQFASVSIQAVLNLLVFAVLARRIAAADFGAVAVVQIFIGLALVLAEGGATHALIQRKQVSPRHIRAAAALTFVGALCCALVLCAIAASIAAFFHRPAVALLLQAATVSLLLASIGSVPESLLQRELQFQKLMIGTVVAYVIGYGLVGVPMALAGYGAWALVAALLARAAAQSIAMLLLRPASLLGRFGRAEVRDLRKFGAPFTVSRLFDYAAFQGDTFVVGRILGTGALGFYQRAFELMDLPGRFMGKVIEKVLFSAMAGIQEQRERLRSIHLRLIELTCVLLLPLVVLLFVLARELVLTLYGQSWLPMVTPFRILLLSLIFRALQRVAESLVRATGEMRQNARQRVVAAVLVVGGSMAASPWGLPGIATAVALAIAISYAMTLLLTMRLTHTRLFDVLRAFRPGLGLACMVSLVLIPSAHLLEPVGFSAPSLLVLLGALGGAVVLLPLVIAPALVLPSWPGVAVLVRQLIPGFRPAITNSGTEL